MEIQFSLVSWKYGQAGYIMGYFDWDDRKLLILKNIYIFKITFHKMVNTEVESKKPIPI